MTQATPTIGANQSGLAYRNADNDGKKALLNHHKGAAAPGYAEAGIIWIDDTATPWLLKIYDGADWIVLGDVNATTNAFNPYIGTASARVLNDAADTGAANAYAVAPVPAITAYVAGQAVLLRPAHASTGAATLAVNGLAAKNIKLLDGTNPASGALATTGIYLLVYDGTNFVLLNAAMTTITVKDANLTLQDDGDTTKQLQFQLSGITTGTTRTLTAPNKNGTIAVTGDAVATVKKQIFTSSGTYTPSTGMLYCIVEMVGGGGGGGGTNGANALAGGGGAGSYARSVVTAATIGASQSVTVGAAGAGGVNTGGTGTTGGASSVGSLVTTNGGVGGIGATTSTAGSNLGGNGGAGGAAGTADLAVPGCGGTQGWQAGISGSDLNNQGGGGNSAWGAGAVNIITLGGSPTAATGVAATGYGAGGGGAVGASKVGGAGAIGVVFITEFCSQ